MIACTVRLNQCHRARIRIDEAELLDWAVMSQPAILLNDWDIPDGIHKISLLMIQYLQYQS